MSRTSLRGGRWRQGRRYGFTERLRLHRGNRGGLLFAEEDASLDFKREQYAFEGAGKDSKSELLKDILAFVNAFRRADAYILIGVEEIRGKRSTLVGVQEQLDDENSSSL